MATTDCIVMALVELTLHFVRDSLLGSSRDGTRTSQVVVTLLRKFEDIVSQPLQRIAADQLQSSHLIHLIISSRMLRKHLGFPCYSPSPCTWIVAQARVVWATRRKVIRPPRKRRQRRLNTFACREAIRAVLMDEKTLGWCLGRITTYQRLGSSSREKYLSPWANERPSMKSRQTELVHGIFDVPRASLVDFPCSAMRLWLSCLSSKATLKCGCNPCCPT